MRLSLRLSLVCAVLALAACAPSTPMTSEEYMGFCVQQDTGDFICDNISICREYQSVFETQQQTLGECLTQCQTINNNLLRNMDPMSRCWFVATGGEDLCERYCQGKFKQAK